MCASTFSRACFVVALLAAVVATAVPVQRAAAAASITVSSATVLPGGSITVSGAGFKPNVLAAVFANFAVGSGTQHTVVTPRASASGSFVTLFTVPSGANPGRYTLTATDFSGNTVTRTLTVLPLLHLLPATVAPHTITVVANHTFAVEGTGFRPAEGVKVTATFPLATGNSLTVTRTAQANASGIFSATLQVPNGAAPGTYTVTATGVASATTENGKVAVVYRPFIYPATKTAAPGATLTVYGGGFIPRAPVGVQITIPRNGTTTETLTNAVTPDSTGSFSTRFAIPAEARLGTDGITATDSAHSLTARSSVVVSVHPAISLKPSTAAPGQKVTVSGGGFGASVRVTVSATVTLNSGGAQVISTTASTGPRGNFAATLTVPGRAAASTTTVVAQGPNGQATAALRISAVSPAITVSPASVLPGRSLTVTGHRFPAGDRVTLAAVLTRTSGATVTIGATVTASAAGSFTAPLQVPGDAAGGVYTVTATSATSGREITSRMRVAALRPSVVAVPTTATPGTSVSASGFGFAAGVSVTLSLGGVTVASTRTNASGQFTSAFIVPSTLASGAYTLTASGSDGRKASIAFTVNRTISTHFYFASLYTGSAYHEYIALLNPSQIRSQITIQYLLKGGAVRTKSLSLTAHTRATEDVNADLGPNVSGSAVVSADVPIAAERVMYRGTDGAVDRGAPSPASVWYFANGNTSHGYREYIAIQNPNSSTVSVGVTFLPTHGKAFTVTKSMAPTSRLTVKVNEYVPHDAVGVTVSSAQPIVANRSIFIKSGTTSTTGVNAPSKHWYFAAGPTNSAAKHWIAAINPSGNWTYVTLHAYAPDGSEVATVKGWLKPYARVGYLINKVAHRTDVAVLVTGTNSIIAEQMTYAGKQHQSSTDAFGVPAPAKSWTWAAANTAASRGESDTLDLFNPSLDTVPIVVQFISSGGQVTQRTYVVGPLSHQGIDVGSVVPEAQLGIVAASSSPFVAMNRLSFNNGQGAATSDGIPGQ